MDTLKEIIAGEDHPKAVEAKGSLNQIQQFEFVITLIIFDRLLVRTKGLSDLLQNTQLNLAEAASLVSGTIELLNVFRTNIEWDKVYNYAKSVYETHVNNIEVASNHDAGNYLLDMRIVLLQAQLVTEIDQIQKRSIKSLYTCL